MNFARTLVLGDIHGANRALEQVLNRASFDPANDHIIFLGDVADSWSETREAIDTLLTIPHLTHLLGNHDEWFYDYVLTGHRPDIWLSQGGQATLDSYTQANPDGYLNETYIPATHLEYLRNAKYWHQEGERIFVHGGWIIRLASHPQMCAPHVLIWDRTLWDEARDRENFANTLDTESNPVTMFDEVYIGHTTTSQYSSVPTQACEIWNLDQGAGWEGKLSLMDIDSKEYWQSDIVATLYPDEHGRR